MLRPQRPIPYAAASALFAIFWLALAGPWLSGAVTVPWDAKAQFYPELMFLAKALKAGESPFWAPEVFAGWPQIADPQSLIFSPGHLLLALFDGSPSFRAADAVSFVLLLIGGFGVILLFRDRLWHPAGALVAALAFAFGGSAASRIQHTGQIVSLAFLPVALWLLERALRRRSAGSAIAAGIAAACIALGRDQVALLCLFVLTGAVAAHWLTGPGRRARFRASLKPLSLGGLAGALVIAVPLMLTALLAADSQRPVMDYLSAGRGSLHPAHLLTLVFPDLYGATDAAVDYWGPPSFPWGPTDLFLAQNMGQLYLGSLPVAAVLLGMARGAFGARDIRFYLFAAAFVILYALGWYTPAFRFMFDYLPGVALFRRPADASFVLCALLAMIGGYGVHRLLSKGEPVSPMRAVLAVALAGAAVAGTAVWLATSKGAMVVAVQPLLIGAALLITAVVVIALAQHLARNGPFAAMVLAGVFMTADLAWNNGPNESTGLPPAMYDALRLDTANETIRLIEARLAATGAADRRDRIELAGIGYHWPNSSLVHGFDHVFGHNPLRLREFAHATGVGDTIATPDQRKFSPLFPSYRSLMADMFGLRFIVTGVPAEQIDPSLKSGDLMLLARTADAFVYENPRALPRVLVAAHAQRADFPQMIADGRWPEFDPRRTVLLQRDAGHAGDAAGNQGTASLVRYGNTEVIVDVDAPAGGFLVLNDVWHPWWRAHIDGTPAEILKANVLFRAVPVPRGKSRVTFAFDPFAGAVAELRRRWIGAGLFRSTLD